MRKLASVQVAAQVFPHPNADQLELVQVNGWVCVTGLHDFKSGDMGVYFEIDAFLPGDDGRYAFLEKTFRTYLGKSGARIKTIRLRGEASQGLLLPLSSFPEIVNPEVGLDVTELLGIIKYEKPMPLSVDACGNLPSFIEATDQERVQNLTSLFDSSGLWEKTEKMEGTSMTAFYVTRELAQEVTRFNDLPSDVHFGICSHNLELINQEQNPYWKAARTYCLQERLEALGQNLALQGELIGPKIQDNIYKLFDYHFVLFDVFDIDQKRKLLPYERMALLRKLNEMPGKPIEVPFTEYVSLSRGSSWREEVIRDADGPSHYNPDTLREGYVYKHTERQVSFKAVSIEYLIRSGK